jgi:hypothetical protein
LGFQLPDGIGLHTDRSQGHIEYIFFYFQGFKISGFALNRFCKLVVILTILIRQIGRSVLNSLSFLTDGLRTAALSATFYQNIL